MALHPRQGDIWLTDFLDHEGTERPAVVVSRNELNRGEIILVVPCTSSRVDERAQYTNHVLLRTGKGGLTKDSVAQVHLIQPIETASLIEKLGELDDEDLGEILVSLAWTVDLFDKMQ